MPTRNPSSNSLKSELGDRIGYWSVKNKPFVLGERTESNKELYDAVKGHEKTFQKLVAITAAWQDGVGAGYKLAFKDAFEELPQSVKDLITEPKEKINELYRGVKESYDEMIEKMNSEFDDRPLPSDPDEQRKMLDEHNENLMDTFKSADVMGFTPIKDKAMDFGRYLISGAEDVRGVNAIISTQKLLRLAESVFKPETISDSYKVGKFGRFYAKDEDEYIVLGVRLKMDADQMTPEWRESHKIDHQLERERRDKQNGY